MHPFLNKLLTPRHAYLTVNQNMSISEASFGAQRFAYCPEDLSLGEDIRVPFPELIGIEDTLFEILEGQHPSFEIKGVARSDSQALALIETNRNITAALSDSHSPLYFDLYISQYCEQNAFENRLLVFLEDTTERMVLEQALAQRTNEASLLLSSLAASKKYIDRIILSMADALLVTTETGIIKTVNQSTQSLFGYSQEELIGQSITKLISDNFFLQKSNPHSSSFKGEFIKDVEVICQTKTRGEISVAFSCSVIQTDIEELQNFVYIGRDITERKRAEVEMIKALEREKELRELKSRFISMASHEFRTPITSILSSTELLEKYSHGWIEDKKLKHYYRIKDSVKRMTELLEDVLIVSKAESGKLKFNPKPLVLKNFCTSLVEEIQVCIGKKHNIHFVCLGQEMNPCLDEKLLLHILNNLLINAIKYSPEGSTVRFGCYSQKEAVVFEIQDEGIGISVEDQQRLFESFHRGKNVGTIPGTGLGLAIAKNAVELQGGKITFTSEVGVGTTFRVTVPLNHEHESKTH